MIWVGSGHGIDPRVTPVYRRVAGGGSFFNSPFVLYDQLITETYNGGQVQFLQWIAGTSTLATFNTSVDTVPLQYHTSRPGTPPGGSTTISLRRIADLGPDSFDFSDLAPIGTWHTLAGNLAMRLPAPGAAPNFNRNTSTYEMAFTADVATIMARATITIEHIGA